MPFRLPVGFLVSPPFLAVIVQEQDPSLQRYSIQARRSPPPLFMEDRLQHRHSTVHSASGASIPYSLDVRRSLPWGSVKVGDESGAIDLYFYQLTAFCTEEGKRLILDQLVYICVLVGLIPLLVTIYVVL